MRGRSGVTDWGCWLRRIEPLAWLALGDRDDFYFFIWLLVLLAPLGLLTTPRCCGRFLLSLRFCCCLLLLK